MGALPVLVEIVGMSFIHTPRRDEFVDLTAFLVGGLGFAGTFIAVEFQCCTVGGLDPEVASLKYAHWNLKVCSLDPKNSLTGT